MWPKMISPIVDALLNILRKVDYLMDCGSACPFCDHHYAHEETCQYEDALRALEDANIEYEYTSARNTHNQDTSS